jgi:hypothetical protein
MTNGFIFKLFFFLLIKFNIKYYLIHYFIISIIIQFYSILLLTFYLYYPHLISFSHIYFTYSNTILYYLSISIIYCSSILTSSLLSYIIFISHFLNPLNIQLLS